MGDKEISTRHGLERDVQSIVQFQENLASETEDKTLCRESLKKGVMAVISDSNLGFYVVCEVDNAIVGGLMVTFEWSDWRNQMFWWIQSVYVNQDYRRRGVFSELYSYVIDCARRTTKICGIRLYVERDNYGAQKTYYHLGMEESKYLMYEMDLMPGT
jgi:GNAT superfamily N-acetyltransferase